MDIKFSKDSDDSPQAAGDIKEKQNVLLAVLLVVIGATAYIYFFTGLIKPMPEQKVAEAPSISQVAKKPLPAPDGTPPTTGTGETKKDAVAPAMKPEPAVTAPVAAAPAPVAAAKPVAKEPAKPKEEQRVAEEVRPTVKKALPSAGKTVENKPAPVEKKRPAVAENKALPSKDVVKPVDMKKPVEKQRAAVTAASAVKKVSQKPVKKAAVVSGNVDGSGAWTVLVGNYVLEDAMAADLARIRTAGLEAYVVAGAMKKNHMNRLLLAEFTDRESARAELARLKRFTADAFMIDNAGMHAVYAGSYMHEAVAASEKERLAAAGFKLTIKRADVSIPTKNLTAGSFVDKSAAEDVLKKLRAADIKATLSRQ